MYKAGRKRKTDDAKVPRHVERQHFFREKQKEYVDMIEEELRPSNTTYKSLLDAMAEKDLIIARLTEELEEAKRRASQNFDAEMFTEQEDNPAEFHENMKKIDATSRYL